MSESDRRARQSGRAVQRHAAQRRLRGASTSWRGARRSTFESAPAEALMARWRRAAERRRRRAAGQAADVHEPERRRRSASWRGTSRSTPADLLVVVDEVQLPLGQAPRAGARIGRRAQRAEVGDRAPRRRVCAAADRRRARRRRGGISRITCCRVRQRRSGGGRAHDRARGRCGGDVHHLGDRRGDEPVQRRRSGNNRIALSEPQTRPVEGQPCHHVGGRGFSASAVRPA